MKARKTTEKTNPLADALRDLKLTPQAAAKIAGVFPQDVVDWCKRAPDAAVPRAVATMLRMLAEQSGAPAQPSVSQKRSHRRKSVEPNASVPGEATPIGQVSGDGLAGVAENAGLTA